MDNQLRFLTDIFKQCHKVEFYEEIVKAVNKESTDGHVLDSRVELFKLLFSRVSDFNSSSSLGAFLDLCLTFSGCIKPEEEFARHLMAQLKLLFFDQKDYSSVGALLHKLSVRHRGVLLVSVGSATSGQNSILTEVFDSLAKSLPEVLEDPQRFRILMTLLKTVGQALPVNSLEAFLTSLNGCLVDSNEEHSLSEIAVCLASKADQIEEVIASEAGLTLATGSFARSFRSKGDPRHSGSCLNYLG